MCAMTCAVVNARAAQETERSRDTVERSDTSERRAALPAKADDIGDRNFRNDQARASAGDKDAAYRVGQMYRSGTNGVPRDSRKMVEWLRYASELGSGAASYQLYVHYLELGLDRDALYYENRALQQGFVPPPRLDPRRG